MFERVIWHPRQLPQELESPFQRGENERPFRLTLHCSSFCDLSDEEEVALSILRNLSDLPELDIMEIQTGSFSYATFEEMEQALASVENERLIRISPFDPDLEKMSIYTGNAERFSKTYMYSRQFLELTAYLSQLDDPEAPEFQSMLDDIIEARAHCELKRDVLVTKSPRLLKHRGASFIQEATPRTLLDAARIVGLFLRSRDLFIYRTVLKKGSIGITRGSFYSMLVDLNMPNFWHYQNKCKHAGILLLKEGHAEDDTGLSVDSALTRCIRALQACDAIGEKFYVPLDDGVRSVMLYHFYYLALLLSGVLDVQALIAHRAYGITGLPKYATFIKPTFIRKLQKNDAITLSNIFSQSSEAYHLIRLLHEIRNTIHRAEFPQANYPGIHMREVQSSGAFVQVDLPPDNLTTLLDAVNELGSLEKWGLIQTEDGFLLEPYTFSYVLVKECFKLIEKISESTDLSGLFPDDYLIPVSLSEPPKDKEWNRVRRSIAVLG